MVTVIDAENLLLGGVSSIVASGVLAGEEVAIINAEKAVLTGSKLDKKFYHHHTGWIGGMKSVNYRTMMATKADKAMYLAVEGMLPGNKLGAKAMTRLRVYKGAQHEHAAQKPEAIEL